VAPGRTIGGRYRIVEKIGRGGHGEVYRAQQLPLGRDVALKVLLPEAYVGEGPGRFAREATLVQTLDHPNTVRLYDFGVDDSGFPFMAFELLRGRTLEEEIEKGPLSPDRVARIATQVLKALMDAHARGIVHRDIKPSNVFLVDFAGEKDFVKVLDFGVARRTVPSSTQPRITSDGEIVGTPAYMAPEQVKDEPIGPATDVYSLGLVVAEALTGEMVVYGKSGPEIWIKQASSNPVELSPRVLASALGPVIVRATNKSPADRFTTAEEMLDAIERAMATGSAETDPLAAPMTERMPPPPRPVATPREMRSPTPVLRAAPSRSASSSLLRPWAVALIAVAAMAALVIVVVRQVFRRRVPAVRIEYPLPSAEVEAPPMLPVVETVVGRGWEFTGPVGTTRMNGLVGTSFLFRKLDPGLRIFKVFVFDFSDERGAILKVENDARSPSRDIVRRRAKRVLVISVDHDESGEGPAVAAQLLP
jgi:serine/threonine-protein kinase